MPPSGDGRQRILLRRDGLCGAKGELELAGVVVDFLGFSIADRFVVGYGLDAAGLYRNVPFIGVVRS
jgi:hypoxanthine phosphoribosyltransferase